MAEIIRLRQVITETGLSRSSIYRLVKSGEFPPPIKLSARSSGWCKDEIESWKKSRIGRTAWIASA